MDIIEIILAPVNVPSRNVFYGKLEAAIAAYNFHDHDSFNQLADGIRDCLAMFLSNRLITQEQAHAILVEINILIPV